MKISEAAAASGCHIETIRYYERIDLLPRPARTAGNYRSYSEEEVQRVRFITRGRALGFSLEEVRSLLALACDESLACSEVDRVARHHLGEIRMRVRELNRMAKELERTISACSGGQRAQCAILDALRTASSGARRRPENVHV
jgi:MerR family mercuric resistance operon transcriptional regulator